MACNLKVNLIRGRQNLHVFSRLYFVAVAKIFEILILFSYIYFTLHIFLPSSLVIAIASFFGADGLLPRRVQLPAI